MRLFIALASLSILAIAGAWDTNFKSLECYSTSQGDIADLWENRMPLSMENFVSLVEKYERQHTMTAANRIADSLLGRYRVDGIVYDPIHPQGLNFQPKETFEVDKEDVLKKLIEPSFTVPENTFDPREECSLHFMLSHSTDTYPHSGIDDFWLKSGRSRRQVDNQRFSSYSQPGDVMPATHPIENGVVQSPAGPIALGTLLAGISTTLSGNLQSISNVLGVNEVTYMPDEMQVLRLDPLYVSTLSGDIGQSALKAATISSQTKLYLGSLGLFSNSTAAPKLFTLKDGHNGFVAYLTRAEIFAGIDAMLINKYLRSSSFSGVKLSQILRMYYSDKGLPGFQGYKACNRMDAYNTIKDDTTLQEQALNFMYAYSDYDSLAQRFISENRDNFQNIKDHFTPQMTAAYNAFSSFINSYAYDDYGRCDANSNKNNQAKCENTVDLVVVYNREGGIDDSQAQREYITLLAEAVGVSQTRSRLGMVDARNADWLLPVTNVSNIADLGANFTQDSQTFGSGGSSTDMLTILDALRNYYSDFYNVTNSSAQNATANSQVVVWNVPRNAPDFNNDDNLLILRNFRLDFPNVYFLLVGTSSGNFLNVLRDREKDFIKIDTQNPSLTATQLAERVCQIPKMFVYPACDTLNPLFENYNEDSHIFRGFVSPNYTTYAEIAPQNFKYSYSVSLTLQSNDITVCASRLSMNVDPSADDYQCLQAVNDQLEYLELCTDSNLTLCNPIYLSIAGTPHGNTQCNVDGCMFPDQVEYKISHQGLVCGAWSFSVSLLLLVIVALIHLLLV